MQFLAKRAEADRVPKTCASARKRERRGVYVAEGKKRKKFHEGVDVAQRKHAGKREHERGRDTRWWSFRASRHTPIPSTEFFVFSFSEFSLVEKGAVKSSLFNLTVTYKIDTNIGTQRFRYNEMSDAISMFGTSNMEGELFLSLG